MSRAGDIALQVVLWLAIAAIGAWLLHRWRKRSIDDAIGAPEKLAITLLMLLLAWAGIRLGPFAPFVVVLCAVILSLTWTGGIAEFICSRFLGMTHGGGDHTPRPLYSLAQGKRARGQTAAAIAEVEAQLAQFPDDFEGRMLLATIHAEDRRNLDAAQEILHEWIARPRCTPSQTASALTTLADWQLKYRQNPAGAAASFRRIMECYPDSSLAMRAAQRLARLEPAAELDETADPGTFLSDCLKQLARHPLDNATREQLARAYYERHGDLDTAQAELEKLIATPHQTPKDIARWLQCLSEWQLREGNATAARATLERILALFPKSVQADEALTKITRLG
jgi:thioredoxin-like negative regulator of GroEL